MPCPGTNALAAHAHPRALYPHPLGRHLEVQQHSVRSAAYQRRLYLPRHRDTSSCQAPPSTQPASVSLRHHLLDEQLLARHLPCQFHHSCAPRLTSSAWPTRPTCESESFLPSEHISSCSAVVHNAGCDPEPGKYTETPTALSVWPILTTCSMNRNRDTASATSLVSSGERKQCSHPLPSILNRAPHSIARLPLTVPQSVNTVERTTFVEV